jgi:hypothetical protein
MCYTATVETPSERKRKVWSRTALYKLQKENFHTTDSSLPLYAYSYNTEEATRATENEDEQKI